MYIHYIILIIKISVKLNLTDMYHHSNSPLYLPSFILKKNSLYKSVSNISNNSFIFQMRLALSMSALSIQKTLPSSEDFNSPVNLSVLYNSTIYLVPSSCIQSLKPQTLGFSIVRPVSSFISLTTDSSSDSPSSTWPPGNTSPFVPAFSCTSTLLPSHIRHIFVSSISDFLLILIISFHSSIPV